MIQDTIAKDGFIQIRDFFRIEDLEVLEGKLNKYIKNKKVEKFTYSLLALELEERKEVSVLVRDFFEHKLHEKFDDFKFISGSFLIKPSLDQSILSLHQDWSYVWQNRFPIYTCWSPLMDTDEMSGSLFFLKGSHQYFNNFRSKDYETARINALDAFGSKLVSLVVKRGDLVLFNPSVFHGSYPNLQNIQRIAITCLAMPSEAEVLYFSKLNNEFCQPIVIGDEGVENYLAHLVNGVIPQDLERSSLISYSHQIPELGELLLKSKV